MSEARWYCVDSIGQATLCASEDDANTVAAESFVLYPKGSPYRAVRLGDVAALLAERDRLRADVAELLDCLSRWVPIAGTAWALEEPEVQRARALLAKHQKEASNGK